jgi:hypothetical protein
MPRLPLLAQQHARSNSLQNLTDTPLECYRVVKAAIEEILDDKMNRDEKEKRRNLISGEVAQVYSDLKYKNQSQDSA